MSERVTEQIVRQHLHKYALPVGAMVWEQVFPNQRVQELLKKASKTGKQGVGRPEFVVRFEDQSDFLMVVECKADPAKHESRGGDRPADFAVDGVLHYAKHLSQGFNVLAIAVSGMSPGLLSVSHFWHLQGESGPKPADFPAGNLHPLGQYLSGYRKHGIPRRHGLYALDKLARDLNSRMHHLKITPADRTLLVSAILIALQEDKIPGNHPGMSGADLLDWVKRIAIKSMRQAGVEDYGIMALKGKYGFMDEAGTGALSEGTNMADMVEEIRRRGMPLIARLGTHDSIGRFYLEFLRYSNNDKELGIVLTPPHITDLAAELAGAGKNDIAYDNCAGTGGFLISAMKRMLHDAEGDEKKQEEIRKFRVVGLELNAGIVCLLHYNMYLHGDGRSNMKLRNCFKPQAMRAVKELEPTVGLLNPPFKDRSSDTEEMAFVLNNLEVLKEGGDSMCVALLPMSWTRPATGGAELAFKRQLLDKHTLEAVISLPDNLFYNSKASVVTCLMVIRAHRPHAPGKKTWFAYGKNDGFEMRHHFGRVDHKGRWDDIVKEWVARFHNRDVVPGFSVSQRVRAEDEWCAEAYIQADYGALKRLEYQRVVRDFVLENKRASWGLSDPRRATTKSPVLTPLSDIFDIENGHNLPYNQQVQDGGGLNFVGRGSTNNGVKGRIAPIPGVAPKPAGMLTVAGSGSVLEAFLQIAPFYTGVGTLCLKPRRQMSSQAKLYYCMLIRANKFRYNYGRAANTTLGEILLPAPGSIPKWVEGTVLDME